MSELQLDIKVMKQDKAVGLDDMLCEQLKHLGSLWWILETLNNCLSINNISKLWRQARTVATLKPGKDPANSKSFRPIALLSHTYKLFETHSKSSGFLCGSAPHYRASRFQTWKILHKPALESHSILWGWTWQRVNNWCFPSWSVHGV